MSTKVWEGDWLSRIQERVVSRGYDDVADFAAAHASLSWVALARELGSDVAAVQLMSVLGARAEDKGLLRKFLADSLVRFLAEYIPQGWPSDESPLPARAFGAWSSDLPDEFEESLDLIFDRIEHLAEPGWLPTSASDPVIREAFQGVSLPQRR